MQKGNTLAAIGIDQVALGFSACARSGKLTVIIGFLTAFNPAVLSIGVIAASGRYVQQHDRLCGAGQTGPGGRGRDRYVRTASFYTFLSPIGSGL